MANSISPSVNTNIKQSGWRSVDFFSSVLLLFFSSIYGADQALSCCFAMLESPFLKKKKKSSPQLHFYRLQFSGRGRQDQVPEQDGSADHLQRHAGQCLPEKEVNVTLATLRN